MAEPVVVFTGEPYSTVIVAVIQIVLRIFGIDLKSLFGFGETRINAQRNQIKRYFTPIFQRMNQEFGWPLHQYTFLDYKSKQVKVRLGWRPEIAVWESEFDGYLQDLGKGFGLGRLNSGERQRIVRQYFANAIQSGWTPEMIRNLFRAVVVAEYLKRDLPVPLDLLPPAVIDPPFQNWTREQLDDYNWLLTEGFTDLQGQFWVNRGFYVYDEFTPIPNQREQIPQWPGTPTGLSWNGSAWFATQSNPEVVMIDQTLWYKGRQITWDSWSVAVTQGPSELVFIRPPSYTPPSDPQPSPQPTAPRYRCVQGVCVIDQTGPFATLAECQQACAVAPPDPPQGCPPPCQGQIDLLRQQHLLLNDFVRNTVYPVALDALRRANEALACCQQQGTRQFDLTKRLEALEDYVFNVQRPQIAGLQYDTGIERQQRQAGDQALHKRLDDLFNEWERLLREAEARAITAAVRGVGRALPFYLSPGNIAWWIARYPPPNNLLHETVKKALAEQLAGEETKPDPADGLLVRAPAEVIPVES